jgi:ectoine hydroxylase-related dioxygenase (phytanoyl-CoA dioxygenase family)
MTDEQRYLFDVQGYLVLKGVLSPQQVAECNAALERIEQTKDEDFPRGVVLGKPRSDSELYVSNIVEAAPAFYQLIDIPEVIDVIKEVSLGLYRLNHTYSIHRWKTGYTYMHMGAIPLHPKATYACVSGQMFSLTTKAVFPILNSRPEDGCFAVIPGSHKANYKRPWGNHPDENPMLVPVLAAPGDAIVFTEAVAHGSLVNSSGRSRRTIYYCYSVGYMPDWTKLGLTFSEGFADRLTPQQREILRLKIT